MIGAIVGAIGSIYTGIISMKAANEMASDMRDQGDIAYAEAVRTSNIVMEEGYKFAAAQSLQYIGSGVQIAGSALVTLEQTRKYAATEADAIRTRGQAERELAYSGSSRKQNEGRASLFSGITGAVGKFATVGVQGKTGAATTTTTKTDTITQNYNAPDYYYKGYNTPGSYAWYGA